MVRSPAACLLLLLGAPAWSQEAPPPPAAAPTGEGGAKSPSEDLVSFRETSTRFVDRMKEFKEEARRYAEIREAEERGTLEANYSAVINDLGKDDASLRATAIARFEGFLQKYPAEPDSAHVAFRLAELELESSEERYMAADAEFRQVLANLSDDDYANAPEEPRKDFRKSIQLYQRILRNHPGYEFEDGTYFMLGYCLSEPNSAQYDDKQGRDMFQALVDRYPQSQFASTAHLQLGEYYFDQPNQLDKAIPHYERVVELEGRDGKNYDKGLYKLAWSYYRKNDYERALSLLDQLIVWSAETQLKRSGKESPMVPEAIEYTAISLSDVSLLQGKKALDVAKAFYGAAGPREHETKIYTRLADILTQLARYDEAIGVYLYLQERWPNNPENPNFQWKVASLYSSLVPPDIAATQAAIATLNERYNDSSAWWRANRANPDALAVARAYIEQSLASVAVSVHDRATQTNDPADWLRAAELYGQYLVKFPFADDYYEIQWYRAETLLSGGDLARADKEYAILVKGGEHNYREAAAYKQWAIAFDAVQKAGGSGAPPPNGAVEAEKPLPSGQVRAVFALGDPYKTYLDRADRLLGYDFDAALARVDAQIAAESDKPRKERLERERENLAFFVKGFSENRAAIEYIGAQMLYWHGRFDEARPRLQGVIDRFPLTEEAAFSANLIVDSYTDEEDYANVRKYASIFGRMRLGPGDASLSKDLGTREQQAALKLIEQLVAAGKREEAAEGYLAFRRDYPKADPELLKLALYNAANSYDIVGRLDLALPLFEEYIERFPDDDRSRTLYFRLAGNYGQSLELQKAITLYEQLYDRTNGRGKPFVDSPAALYNAAFLRTGTGDFAGAARNFERYGRENPDLQDAERVYFQAGEQWERVGRDEAIRFYRGYLKRWGDASPDRVMEAQYRIAMLTEEKGNRRDVDAAWDDLRTAWRRLAPAGVGMNGRRYAAQAEVRLLIAEVDEFKQMPPGVKNNEKKYTEAILKKIQDVQALDAKLAQLIQQYQDFESSSAGLYLAGAAYLQLSEHIYNAPLPPGVDDDTAAIIRDELEKIRQPIEDNARSRLLRSLDLGKSQRLWSEWQTKSLDELARLAPAEFASEKPEVRGKADTVVSPKVLPAPILPPAPPPAPAPAGGAP
jgi:TolA-binding protein